MRLGFSEVNYWVNVGVDGQVKERHILHDIQGECRPGEFMAILGPTGAGKSTLLNLLGGRLNTGRAEGVVTFNGKPLVKSLKRFTAYVLQDDTLLPNLTVRETLMYSALLRLPGSLGRETKMKRVQHVLDLLNLNKCADSLVGGMFMRGISGGERRRLTIGNELIPNPSLLLCDEPTSGLDSSTAHTVVDALASLARAGRTVISTIHQPSSAMFAKFHKVMLLADGKVVYFGAVKEVADYFDRLGFPCPRHYNIAEFMLNLVTDELLKQGAMTVDDLSGKYLQYSKARPAGAETEAEAEPAPNGAADPEKKINGEGDIHLDVGRDDMPPPTPEPALPAGSVSLEDMGKKSSAAFLIDSTTPGKSSSSERWATTFSEQLYYLLLRCSTQSRGDKFTGLYLGQYLTLSLVVGLIWFQIKREEEHIEDRVSVLFFITTFWSFNALFLALSTFPAERAVLMRERAAGCYRVSAFYLAKCLSDILTDLLFPSMFMIIAYWLAGLNHDFGRFIASWVAILLVVLVAQSVGFAFSTAVLDFKRSLVFAGTFMLTSMLLGGFYADSANIPIWLNWVQYLSFVSYSFRLLIYIEFNDASYDCATTVPSAYEACQSGGRGYITGEDVITRNDFDKTSVGGTVAVLLAMLLFFRIVAYMFLRRNGR